LPAVWAIDGDASACLIDHNALAALVATERNVHGASLAPDLDRNLFVEC
jgi:hypothetical protein